MGATDWLDLMPQTVTWEPRTGIDDYGAAVYGPGQSLRCRIVKRQRVIRDVGGFEIIANATVYIAGHYGIKEEDRLTFPDGDTPKIIRVNAYPDENGDHHEEVLT